MKVTVNFAYNRRALISRTRRKSDNKMFKSALHEKTAKHTCEAKCGRSRLLGVLNTKRYLKGHVRDSLVPLLKK
jgi:hypothetical protein